MPFIRESYSFADFVTRWAEESDRNATDLAVFLAQAILEGEVESDVHCPNDPGPSNRQDVPYEENTDWQAFEAGVLDHLHFVDQGTEPPDLARRLRYVILDRTEIEAWLTAHGEAMPRFWRQTELDTADAAVAPGANAALGIRNYQTMQRVIAALAWLLAERSGRLKHIGRPNVAQIRNAALELVAASSERKVWRGLGRANFDAIVGAAVKELEGLPNIEPESDA